MTDIIDRINELIAEPAASCWRCRRPILDATEDGFCSETCQRLWHAAGRPQKRSDDKPGLAPLDPRTAEAMAQFAQHRAGQLREIVERCTARAETRPLTTRIPRFRTRIVAMVKARFAAGQIHRRQR